MKYSEVIALFPIEIEVTENILRNVDIYDPFDCIGARTLKSINIGEEWRHSWAFYGGTLRKFADPVENYINVWAYDLEGNSIDMSEIKKPCKIVFSLNATINVN